MSRIQGVGWFAAPNSIFDAGLSSSEILVLTYLFRCAGPDGSSWPGQPAIAMACGLAERTVRTALLKLADGGFVAILPRYEANGKRTSNLYRIQMRQMGLPPAIQPPAPRQNIPHTPANGTDEVPPIEVPPTRKDPPSGSPRSPKPSDQAETTGFFKESGGTEYDALQFYDYNESKGWIVGRVAMKDWKAAARRWMRTTAKEARPAAKGRELQTVAELEARGLL